MDLAELKFVVNTEDLDNAAKKIDALGVAVSKVNKPITRATLDTEKLAKSQAEVAESSAKASLAQLKLQQAQENSTRVTGNSTTVLERQQMILQFMTDGFSKGQASQLAYAKAARASAGDLEALGQVLQTQRKLMGTDPFDKSMGALQSLRNEYTVIKEVQRLYNAELGLSKSQMENLAKEKLRLIEKLKLENASLTDIKNGIMELNAAYLKNASAENAITTNLKTKQKATLDAARANEYMIKELDRVNRLTEEQGNITSATNNAIIRFDRALKMSGLSAAEQIPRLEAYKKSLMDIQKQSGNRQVDYLSRALGPQITDVFVGLTTGQSPLMVLLQQGGQLRDQFALAGVAGKDMGDMLTKATLGMVSSVKDVGIAVGSALVGAFNAAGKSVLNFIGNITGVNSAIDNFKRIVVSNGEVSFGYIGILNTIGKAFVSLAAVGIASGIAAFIAYGIALKQVIQEESALSKSLALTGASLGVTQDSALQLSKELAGSKGNVGSYVTAITELAKVGGVTSDNLKTVASTIVQVSRVTGISAAELAKNFSKISEKPLEGLIPFAKELGTINIETLKQIDNLERAGKKTEAVKLATDAYASSLKDAADTIRNDMGYLESFFFTIGESAKSMWNSILNLGRKETIKDRLSEALGTLSDLQAGKGFMTNQYRQNSIQVAAAAVSGILDEIAAEQKLGETKAKNSKAAAGLPKQLKERNEALTYYQNMIKRIANIEAEATAGTTSLNTAQKEMVSLLNDPEFMKQSLQVRQKAMADLVSASAKIEQSKALEAYNKIMKSVVDIEIEAIAAGNDLNKAEKERLKLASDPAYLARSDAEKKNIQASLDRASAVIDEVSVEKDLLKAIEDSTKAYNDKQVASYDLGITSREASNEATRAAIMEGQALDYQSSILSKTERERNKLLKVRQVELELQKEILDLDKKVGLSAVDRENLKAEAATRAAIKLANVNKTINYEDDLARVQAYGSAFENVFTGMADAIVEFAKTGKLNFKDLIDNMIADILRFELRKQATSMFEGFGGSVGIMKSIVQAFTGTPISLNAAGNVFGTSGIQAFAKGGSFTNSIVDSPTMFKFAKGTGLMGEAGPEAIMPLRRGADGSLGVVAGGGGSNVSVQVINNSNAQATTNETTDSKGNRKIEVVIGDMTAGEISRSGSASQKSLKSTFGIQTQLIRR